MGRAFLSLLSVGLLCVTFVVTGTTTPASANSGCDQTDPQADVVTSQTATAVGAPATAIVYHVTLLNTGPCNVPDVTISDTAPAAITSISVNPSSWNCGIAGSTVTCSPQSTMGVPGTVDLYITTAVPVGDPTNIAVATVGGGAAACAPRTPTTTCDPVPDNNTSYGGFVTDTSTNRTLHTPQSGQWTELLVPAGHSLGAQIQQLSQACPPGFHACFGQLVSISSASTAPDAQTKTFVYPLSLVSSYGSAVIKRFDTTTNTWIVPPGCKGKTLPDPCLLTKERVKIGSATYVRFVVLTAEDDSWMGDN